MNNKEKKKNIIIWAIISLVIILAIVCYKYYTSNTKIVSNIDNNQIVEKASTSTWNYEDLTITVFDDKRCWNACPTKAILEQMKQLPSIANAKIIEKDFSGSWVSEYLKNNQIDALPYLEFSTDNFDTSKDPVQKNPQTWKNLPAINKFLKPTKNWKFYLEIWASFDPFAKRSDKWFLMVDKQKLKAIKDSSYIKWDKNAKITWLEYSDLECPFCVKLNNSGTIDELMKKYWKDLNLIFNHFPLAFHKNAQPGAEILECLAKQKWSDAFYSLIKTSYSNDNSNKDFLIKEAVKLWANKNELTKCLDSWEFTKKVKDTQNAWVELFNINGTPWNVLINNETWEYKIVSWALPKEAFEKVIDKLLK